MTKSAPLSQEAFLRAYDDYAEPLFRHCYLRLLDRELGKEVMQQTFKRTWEEIANGEHVGNLQLFLYKMANGLVQEARSQQADIREPAAEKEEDHSLLASVSRLDKHVRDVLVLHFIDKFSSEDIAAIIGASVDAVGQRLSEGLSLLHSPNHA